MFVVKKMLTNRTIFKVERKKKRGGEGEAHAFNFSIGSYKFEARMCYMLSCRPVQGSTPQDLHTFKYPIPPGAGLVFELV